MDCHDDTDLSIPPEGLYATDYAMLLCQILDQGVVEFNERTKTRVKILPGGTAMRVDLQLGFLPMLAQRRLNPVISAAEIPWFLRGTQSPEFVQRYTNIWDPFLENGMLPAAYGYRWRHHFGRDQISDAIKLLKADASDRQVVITTWDPAVDGVTKGAKMIPCPTHFTLNIVDGLLHSSLFLRSSDFFVGLPYDAMTHAFLMRGFASELDVGLGSMFITISHVHLYENHWHLADKFLDQEPVYPQLRMRPWDFTDMMMEEFVEEVEYLNSITNHPGYSPKPKLIL